MNAITFTQLNPATTWTINHGFGHKPAVDVIIDTGQGRVKIMPQEVRHVSDTQLMITFANPESGVARLA
jgi:hypothetical protein